MWPWRRRVKAVLESEAGDNATAALAMILVYHGVRVPFGRIRRAIYTDGDEVASAAQIIHAAESFGLAGRGLMVDHGSQIPQVPTPSIAHLRSIPAPPGLDMEKHRELLRETGTEPEHYFGVVARASDRVEWFDTRTGLMNVALPIFASMSSGVFLVFEKGPPLPRARVARRP